MNLTVKGKRMHWGGGGNRRDQLREERSRVLEKTTRVSGLPG